MSRAVHRLLWIPSAIAIAGMTVFFATQPMAIPFPAQMKRYTTGDKSLRIRHPGNWKAHERSMHSVETDIEFTPTRNARMTISVDLAGSLIADIMKSMNSMTSEIASMVPGGAALAGKQKSPLELLHSVQGAHMKKDRKDYADFKDGETVTTQISGREALVTTCSWTAPGLFSSRPMTGRRVTLLSSDHHVSVVYGCLKEMEPIVLPVFKQMLGSMEIDPAGGTP